MNAISLFSGCLGLDLGLEDAGWNIIWACESDDACRRVIARRRPDLEVIPDVRAIDSGMPRADLLAGGFPCQDLSHAGLGKGLEGDRSALWFAMADAIRLLRPRLVLVENVPGLATKMGVRPGESALGTVIADLAEAGYVGSAIRLRAADVGAPHLRERIFLLAADTGCSPGSFEEGRWRRGTVQGSEESGRETLESGRCDQGDRDASAMAPADASGTRRREVSGGASRDEGASSRGAALADHEPVSAGSSGLQAAALADSGSERHDGRRSRGGAGRGAGATGDLSSPPDSDDAGRSQHGRAFTASSQLGASERCRVEALADTDGVGRGLSGLEEPAGVEGSYGDIADGRDGEIEWGIYEPAITNWEWILGRAAPRPTDDRGRLSPEFVEWMMGFPENWTEGESRTARLRMLGNAVQVQCGQIVGAILRGAL